MSPASPDVNAVFTLEFLELLSADKSYTLFKLIFSYAKPYNKLKKICKDIIFGRQPISLEQKHQLKKFDKFLIAFAEGKVSLSSKKNPEHYKALCKLMRIYLHNEKHERISLGSSGRMGKSQVFVKSSKRNENNKSSKNNIIIYKYSRKKGN